MSASVPWRQWAMPAWWWFSGTVAVVGAGMSNFGAFPGRSTRDLFVDAFSQMRGSVDKGLDPNDIEALNAP